MYVLYISMYTCMYIYICMYVCVCVCVRVRACMHACMHVCMYACVCMYFMYVVCVFVCMYVWTHQTLTSSSPERTHTGYGSKDDPDAPHHYSVLNNVSHINSNSAKSVLPTHTYPVPDYIKLCVPLISRDIECQTHCWWSMVHSLRPILGLKIHAM